MKSVSKHWLSVVETVCNNVGFKYNHNGSLIPMLEVMKNALFGRLQYPHPYFIEKGAHSITLVTNFSEAKDAKNGMTEQDTVKSFMKALEIIYRAMD